MHTCIQNSTIQINEQIIDERNKELDNITKDVETINQIYKDLAILVEEQGCHINTIADNIESSLVETQGAVKELDKASKKQKLGCLMS